jgi:hypothetical protein
MCESIFMKKTELHEIGMVTIMLLFKDVPKVFIEHLPNDPY